jgi:hypothetical protein
LKPPVSPLTFRTIDTILLQRSPFLGLDDVDRRSFFIDKVSVPFKAFQDSKESYTKILPKRVEEDVPSYNS